MQDVASKASVLTPKIYLLLYSKYILQLLHQPLFVQVFIEICSMTLSILLEIS